MMTKPIPSTGEPIPVIGLGTYKAFDILPNHSKEQLRQVLNLFFQAGGTLIDTSPMYERSESIIGQLLKTVDLNIETFIATKVWTNGKQNGIREMEGSLRKMNCSSIGLMQVHNLVDVDTHLTTLKEWREKKKIKYIGITHYTDDAFDELAKYLKKHPETDFCQFPYSIARREAEDYFLELCDDLEIATLINRPFEQNDLFVCVQKHPLPEWAIEFGCLSWAQFFLKYILGHKAVTCVIPATSKPNHMADNLVAGTGRLPNINELKRMANYFQAL